MRRFFVLAISLSSTLLLGCHTVREINVRVIDATTEVPVSEASVRVEHRTMYFARPSPGIPMLQKVNTGPDGEVSVQLVSGDSFYFLVEHPRYLPREEIVAPWVASNYRGRIEFKLEPLIIRE